MEYTTLGRTGLSVSRIGLGCGGHSRLGLKIGKSEESAIAVVREAIDLGINIIDTAESYGTEAVVGRALRGVPRNGIVISTKAGVDWQDAWCSAADMILRVEACLQRLETDYIDVFHLHAVTVDEYPYACEELLPALKKVQAEGKIRFIGITETFGPDPSHQMLSRLVEEEASFWDVIMTGFNLLNQSARDRVLQYTTLNNIGTLCMFAVRRALSQPDALKEAMQGLIARGLVDGAEIDLSNPLGFLAQCSTSITDAGYRFCSHEPGIDVVLSGTSSVEHLRENLQSILAPPLPDEITVKLREIFANVDSISGN